MGSTSSIHVDKDNVVDEIIDGAAGGESVYDDSINIPNKNSNKNINNSYKNTPMSGRQLEHATKTAYKGKEPNNRGEDGLQISVKYLIEENKRVSLVNEQLNKKIRELSDELENRTKRENNQVVFFCETAEQKLSRLEYNLACERKEKWSAIESCEKNRIDLINCEKELMKSNEQINILIKELETTRAHAQELERRSQVERTGDNRGETSGENQSERNSSLSQFRADLKIKREARQRALAAITAELSSLREQLQHEKSERRKLERDLEARQCKAFDESFESLISDNKSLKNEIEILTENIERLKDYSSENIKLKFEIKRLKEEMDSLNLNLGELKFEYYDEKRKHERTLRRLKDFEEITGNNVLMQKSWEEVREKFFEQYDQEKEEIMTKTNALKEIVACTRQMLEIRESQVEDLKVKLRDIEESVKESQILKENGLMKQYEKQLENIKVLKGLYEERVNLMEAEKQKLNDVLRDKIKILNDLEKEAETLRNEVEHYRKEVTYEREEKENLDRELRLTLASAKDLENELSIINNLFTQMLLGPFNTGNETDLDKLTELLQENHDLITIMTMREDRSEVASVLPKLLLDIITQVDGLSAEKTDDISDSCDTVSEQSEGLLEENQGAVLPILSYKNAKLFRMATDGEMLTKVKQNKEVKSNENLCPVVREIASNLPKVWKILMELLSYHSTPHELPPGDEKQCYKKVETPYGTRTVISVSKTFIRLKDLIIEKKTLQKELTRLKQLNTHLETRLDDQEKRLSQVQCELHKTWGIVGRMRAQHQQLHNHEKILRYELQEKRVMLSELKQELEYCREKWERARQKNHQSETEWRKLRREFAARKNKGYTSSSLNDSGESGFSDEQNESGEDFDADRSSTQSPIDRKLLDQTFDRVDDSSGFQKSHAIETLIRQSESDLNESNQIVEEARAEERCTGQNNVSQAVETNRTRDNRDLRLKKLEEQCKLLVKQVDITSCKSKYLNNRLEELHEQYGVAVLKKENAHKTQIQKTSCDEKIQKQENVAEDDERPGTSKTSSEKNSRDRKKENFREDEDD